MPQSIPAIGYLAVIFLTLIAQAQANIARGEGPGGIGTTDGNSELQLWFKSDSLKLANGANVNRWNDDSGSGNHGVQNTAARQPMFQVNAFNDSPAVRFDKDFFDGVTLRSQSGNITFVAVLSPDHFGAYHNIIDDADSNAPMLWVDRKNRYELNFGPGSDSELSAQGAGGWDILFAVTKTPGPSEIYLNNATPTGTAPGSLGNPESETYNLFNRKGAQGFVGEVAELIIYDTALNSDEVNAVGWYLQRKYSLNLNFQPANPIFEGYTTNPATYVAGRPAEPNVPLIIGGNASSFRIEPALPGGLNFNPETGVITGTPTARSPEVEYTVTASFPDDEDFATTLNLAVLAQSTLIRYSVSLTTYVVGKAIVPNVPEVIGATPSGFAISPELPNGLSFDSSSGVISGTATAVVPATSYTVTASFAEESDSTFDLRIEVLEAPATVMISEFMASNQKTLDDGDGEPSDWIEIHNFGTEPIGLDGWYLTDRANNLTKWPFPTGIVVPAGGFLVVHASNQDSDAYADVGGNIHTNFSLSAAGEFLGIVEPDGETIAHSFAPDFPPQVTDISYGVASDLTTIGHFNEASPGSTNAAAPSEAGPLISGVTDSPQPIPKDADDIVVTARVQAFASPVAAVTLHYRVMFGDEAASPMTDSGNGTFRAAIPSTAAEPGDMVRWYVTAEDTRGESRREPPFLDPKNSPEFFGTIIEDPEAASPMRTLFWFLERPSRANSRSGSRSSVYFDGQFYGNVFTRVRGASSQGVAKKSYKFEFNVGHHFRFSPDAPRVDEININSTFQDKAYIRPQLTYESYADAGVVASDASTWRMKQNGAFFSVVSFVEQVDADLLSRKGLDPEGALYKMFNGVTSSTSGVEKKTRRNENNSDLQALVRGVRRSNPNRAKFLFDHIDIPAMINYATAGIISQDFDRWAKNFYVYRDTNSSSEWLQIPHDKDLTFGNRFFDDEISGDGFSFEAGLSPERRRAHPFQGAAQHACCGAPNLMIDILVADPRTREMYLRRLRTLMDEQLQPPGTLSGDLRFEARIDELATAIAPDAALDLAKWGAIYGGIRDFPTAIALLKTDYLDERRVFLYEEHGISSEGDREASTLVSGGPGETQARFMVPGDNSLGLDWTAREFDDATWATGNTGFGYEFTPSTYDLLIKTAVRPSEIRLGSTSIFLRIDFDVSDLGTIDALELRMKYDDGFVAYLNGAEMARRNVGGSPGEIVNFDHAAASHSDSKALVFEEIDVRTFSRELVQGGNVLAIHAVNQSTSNSDMLILPELVEAPATTSAHSVGIPGAQPPGATLSFGTIEFNPVSGNQEEEYVEIVNPNSFAVDISGWTVEGAIEHAFKPGTVIPSSNTGVQLFLSPNVNAFRARATSPTGNEENFVQGNYRGQMSARGETITIRDMDGNIAATTNYAGAPSDAQQFLRITELHYHPADPTARELGAGFTDDGEFEFVELKNIGPATIDIGGVRFESGIDFIVPADTMLAAGALGVIVSNQSAFEMRYGAGFNIIGQYSDRLSNDGEPIQLRDAVGENILKFTYNDRWYPATDGDGYALVILDDSADWSAWDLAASWGIGEPPHGSPGAQNGTVILQQYEGWLNRHFGPAEIDDPLISGPGADANGDGRSNFNHYAFGTDPRAPADASDAQPNIAFDGVSLELTYRFRDPALDLEFIVEVSSDLRSWSDAAIEIVRSATSDGITTATVSVEVPGEGKENRRFVRVATKPKSL
jgi:hypothetical protein